MVRIKLTRTGKRNQPQYRIVAVEKRSKRDGQYADLLGTYNPLTNPPTITLDQSKYLTWIKQGAQPTATVRQIVKSLITK